MSAEQLSTEEILNRAREEATVKNAPPEVLEFRSAGGRAHFDETTGEVDVKFSTWSTSTTWRTSLLNSFRELRQIRSLKVDYLAGESAAEIIQGVSDPSVLRSLSLSGARLNDVELQRLARFPNLRLLNLSATPITDRGAALCSTFANLSNLSLSRTSVGDQGIREITKLPELEQLDLSYTIVSDDAVASLVRLSSLHSLDLSDTLVTDSAAKCLTRLPALRRIGLTGSLVTSDGVERFRGLRPDVEIFWTPTLTMIGYWCDDFHAQQSALPQDAVDVGAEAETESPFIHPRRLVAPDWEISSRQEIIRYLKDSPSMGAYCGLSYCRFGCGANGCAELSDGHWTWPEGLAHYVEEHDVRLPDEFLAHLRRNGFTVPEGIGDESVLMHFSTALWRRWCHQEREAGSLPVRDS